MKNRDNILAHFSTLNKAEIKGIPFFSERDTHIAVPLKSVAQDNEIDFNIYSRGPYIIFQPEASQARGNSDKVVNDGLSDQLYIRAEDWKKYLLYIEKTITAILTGEAPLEEKAMLLYQACNRVVLETIKRPNVTHNITRVEQIVDATIDHFIRNIGSLHKMIFVMAFDYSLQSHSVNTCMFGLALGHHLKLSLTDLRLLGTGLMLHDVGKQQTPHEILYKAGPLTEDEWLIMKQHPAMGQMLLAPSGKVDRRTMHIVRSHHEKCSGDGYPDRLIDTELDPLAKIASIADVFDALTTRRVYKNATLSFPALKIMMKEMYGAFDSEYLREFIRMLNTAEQQPLVERSEEAA